MINFFSEEIDFVLENESQYKEWLNTIFVTYNIDNQLINYIFCSDDYLLEVNKTHLNHDYLTDIITFDMRDAKSAPLEADIFISIDRVKENAEEANKPFSNELYRVMAHGVLHLIGYNDKTPEEQVEMRLQEDKCLALLP